MRRSIPPRSDHQRCHGRRSGGTEASAIPLVVFHPALAANTEGAGCFDFMPWPSPSPARHGRRLAFAGQAAGVHCRPFADGPGFGRSESSSLLGARSSFPATLSVARPEAREELRAVTQAIEYL